ncbi:alpha/beta hydrolase [Gordonia zhaorongruii]|uniref:alpha/beta hydrolase n=1 Tax=Gordonia zhaorongruii TaxID=2597659 RepID=UPI0010468110|nr:alpha/beta hydrolase [Gordonia zhaorongruii]
MITDWRPDELLDGFEVRTIPLAADPDGEDPISAHLVRRGESPAEPRGAVLYVHGFTDYFFQTGIADYFHARGYAFYALDLRKCGRSLSPHHQPHYITDLRYYDEELNQALDIVTDEVSAAGGSPRVIVAAHSTGGLVTPLWLDRMRTTDPERHGHIVGLVLNSPWLDLQGEAVLRTAPVTKLITAIGAIRGKQHVPRELSEAYGHSLHSDSHGEWTYDLVRKPLGGFPVTFGWLAAVRAGQDALHAGLNIGVPALVLRSDKSHFAAAYRPAVDTADCVLDVKQIAQWSGCIGERVLAVAVPDARHDVFLSIPAAREQAYAEVDSWMESEFER